MVCMTSFMPGLLFNQTKDTSSFPSLMTYYVLCNFPSFQSFLGFNVAIHSFQTFVWAYCWCDQKLRGRINFRVIGSVFSNLLWLLFSILFLSYSPTHFSQRKLSKGQRKREWIGYQEGCGLYLNSHCIQTLAVIILCYLPCWDVFMGNEFY